MPRHRRYAFTLFDIEWDGTFPADTTRWIAGWESCPDTGKQHIQGYVEFNNQLERNTLVSWSKKYAGHIEPARGTAEQNRAYCSKEGNVLEDGNWSNVGQGHRTDLDTLCEYIAGGHNEREIFDTHASLYIRYCRGITAAVGLIDKPKKHIERTLVWIYGRSGSGKTRFALEMLEGMRVYEKDNTKWWDGYTDQEAVLWDEYDFEDANNALRWLDSYTCRAEKKGGCVYLTYPLIVVTSHYEPEHYFPGRCQEIARRLTESIKSG